MQVVLQGQEAHSALEVSTRLQYRVELWEQVGLQARVPQSMELALWG
jgi:hypothetical protein